MTTEITTVSDDHIVVHTRDDRFELTDLEPDTEYEIAGELVRTLPRPDGERLATIATVNDLHLGETVAGKIGDGGPGPLLSADPGDPPYAEVTNRAAAAEIAALDPDLVVAKGDLTDAGRAEEIALFDEIWSEPFGDRMAWVRGNHDTSGLLWCPPVSHADLEGVRVVLIDTARPLQSGGELTADQIDAIEAAATDTEDMVMLVAHHPLFGPWLESQEGPSFLLQPGPSRAVMDVTQRRRNIVGWFAGHTHRNKVVPIEGSDAVAVEVASIKEFPGAWAEYRVFETGIVQVVHRVQEPTAVAWCERTRELYRGFFAAFALGSLGDRCFTHLRASAPAAAG